jgi:hypothetical protein
LINVVTPPNFIRYVCTPPPPPPHPQEGYVYTPPPRGPELSSLQHHTETGTVLYLLDG